MRYTQQRNLRAALVTKPLLKPVTTHTNGSVYFSRNGKTGAGNYGISVRRGLVHDYLLCVNAVQLEEAIVDRMFEHLQTVDIGDLKSARKQRGEKIARRLAEITRDVGVIDEELANLHTNLKRLTIPRVIAETEASMVRILQRKDDLLAEREALARSSGDEALRTLEEELADLAELWPHKPFELKKNILSFLARRVEIEQVSTRFIRVLVEWRYKEWGIEQTYLVHEEGGRKAWAEEEIARLHEVYPGERDRLAIMRAFPDRSWRAIRHMADSLGLTAGKGQGKGKGVRFQKGQIESLNLSWNDVRWLAVSGLTLKSFYANLGGWSCSSSAVSTTDDIQQLVREVRVLLKRYRVG